MLYYRQKHNFN